MEVLNEEGDLNRRPAMKLLRAGVFALAMAFLVLPAEPLGGLLPVPTVGGQAHAGTCSDGYTPIYGMTWVVISTPIGPVAVPRVIVVACARK